MNFENYTIKALSGSKYETSFFEPERPISIYSDAYFVLEYRMMFRWQ